MPRPPADLQRWQFSTGVIAPVVAALLVTVVAVAGFMVWSVQSVDERSLGRQSRLIGQAVTEQAERLGFDQDSVTVWDEAVLKTAPGTLDPEWLSFNLGSWMHQFYGHDGSIVLDAANRPLFAMRHGTAIAPDGYTLPAALSDMIARLRKSLTSADSGPLDLRPPHERHRAFDVINFDGQPALVSIAPIVSDTGRLQRPPGTESLHIAIIDLDQRLANRIAEQYLFQNPTFVVQETHRPGRAVYPIRSWSGRFVAFIEWDQDRPGQALLTRVAPALAAAVAVGGVLVFLLLSRLWRSSQELARGRREAHHQATHDALTGIANRALFDERVTALVTEPDNGQDRAAVMMLDLDRFKQVNDALGHEAGDHLIQTVAQRLEALLGPQDLIARLGGDEFAIVHTTRGGRSEALALAYRVIEAIGKPFDINGFEAFVGVSIGIAMVGTDGAERAEMARRADIALYEAKARGRNRAVIYEARMGEQLQNRHLLEADLRDALREDGQLSVAFQPLFGRDRGIVTGSEALVRWTHPTLGQLSPAMFIPVAESSGLIEPLGMMVLRNAMLLGARWPGRMIAVNISPAQLRNPRFATDVLGMLDEIGMQTGDLELEITEGTLLADEPVTQQSLRMLREAGVRIALDDFGTGYSSLSYLRRYAVDRIKIDRSFTAQLSEGNVSIAIVQAMITLAHAMGIEVTAEGVETEGQFAALVAMDCDTFQGYLLSAAVSAEQMESMFRTMRPRRGSEADLPSATRQAPRQGGVRVA